jgi:hypothetical protein
MLLPIFTKKLTDQKIKKICDDRVPPYMRKKLLDRKAYLQGFNEKALKGG